MSEAIVEDERTPEQLASDDFAQLLTLGADANPNFLLGTGAPVIRITVPKATIEAGRGLARIEGQQSPITLATVDRISCGANMKAVVIDETGKVLDFGREQRFFTRAQKEALAITWGGCAAPGCERKPSWTEAHHIEFWERDKGKTNLDDGVLLCRHHHLLFHNNNWEIRRDLERRYWLIPPKERDPRQQPIELHTKSRIASDMRRAELAHAAG